VTGQDKYRRAYQQLHTDYLYNPEQTLRYDPLNPFIWTQSAFKWSMWIPWLCQRAPNAKFYQFLFPQFVTWYTTMLNNALPRGWATTMTTATPPFIPSPIRGNGSTSRS